MEEKTFKLRTKNLALETISLIDVLPRSRTADETVASIKTLRSCNRKSP